MATTRHDTTTSKEPRDLREVIRTATIDYGGVAFLSDVARNYDASTGALANRWRADNNPGVKSITVHIRDGRSRKAFLAVRDGGH